MIIVPEPLKGLLEHYWRLGSAVIVMLGGVNCEATVVTAPR